MKRFIVILFSFVIVIIFAMPALAELHRGSKGADVVELQKRLIELGYLDDNADGIFGKNTEAALKTFQEKNGLDITGTATIKDTSVLFSENALSITGSSTPSLNTNVQEATEDGYTVYPKAFSSFMRDYSIPMPDTCYTTTGDENGYPGTPCYITGVVSKIYRPNEAKEGTPYLIVVSNKNGSAFFTVASPEWLALQGLKYDDQDTFDLQSLKAFYEENMDSTMDYTLPEVGEKVKIYGIYDGYSMVLEMAALTFGQDEYLYSLSY